MKTSTNISIDPSEKILEAIAVNHDFVESASIEFITDETVGYIPREHMETYLDTGLFEYRTLNSREVIGFVKGISGFDEKSAAMTEATEALIENGHIERSKEPHFQERAVGGSNRLQVPEFKINRAYYRFYGFPSDAIFINVFTGTPEQPKVLLQKRAGRTEFGNTYDFAAGGAVKFPQTLRSALEAQIKEEIGVSIDGIAYTGRCTFKFSDVDKKWVTNQTHNLFHTFIPQEDIAIGDYDETEVQSFAIVDVATALDWCASGKFNRQNTQAFMSSLYATAMAPEFEGSDHVRSVVEQYFEPSHREQGFMQDPDYNDISGPA